MRTTPLDPFLLPVCPECGGPTSLSIVEPSPAREREDLRTYRCAWCGKSQTLSVKRRPQRPARRAAR
jgi:hypothetical protein